MTGAGFGGCAMALIRAEAADDFVAKTAAAYQQKTGHKPAVYVCQATNGAEVGVAAWRNSRVVAGRQCIYNDAA